MKKTGIALSILLGATGLAQVTFAAKSTNDTVALLEKTASHTANSVQDILHDINGNAIEFPNKTGKWTIVNYWTEWCGPCKREIPALNAFHKNNQDKVTLIGVNSDLLDQKTLLKMTKNLNIHFPVLQHDPIKVVGSLVGTPATYFVSPAGKVYGPLLGPQSERSLLKALDKYSLKT